MHPIADAFEAVFGLPSWNVKKGVGSFITLEFGDPALTVHEPKSRTVRLGDGEPRKVMRRLTVVHGAWHLWIDCCEWSLTGDGIELAHCESSDDTIAGALNVLNGQALESVTIAPTDGSSKFVFDLGCILTTNPAPSGTYGPDPVEQWMLYQPSGQILAVRDDGQYSHGVAENPESSDWQTLPA
jgi:hypothetical protein